MDQEELELMWLNEEVNHEWIEAGETKENKVHLSRDSDGQIYLTHTELRVSRNLLLLSVFLSLQILYCMALILLSLFTFAYIYVSFGRLLSIL